MIEFTAPGVPAPQGSKRHVGGGVMIESSKALKPWRQRVNTAWNTTGRNPIEGPVTVRATFVMPRPKSHYGTGRNTGQIKDTYLDLPHVTKPDCDKLLRAILDALSTTKTQHGAYQDDSHVVRAWAEKRYVRPGEEPHAIITLTPAINNS